MTASILRHRRQLARGVAGTALLALIGVVAVGPTTAMAEDELPPQEPGVTLRSYDMGVPLSMLCTLKPAQTPNVDKLMPSIDWTSAGEFGLSDRFISHVIANLDVPEDGTYAFRLTSDDGSRLIPR